MYGAQPSTLLTGEIRPGRQEPAIPCLTACRRGTEATLAPKTNKLTSVGGSRANQLKPLAILRYLCPRQKGLCAFHYPSIIRFSRRSVSGRQVETICTAALCKLIHFFARLLWKLLFCGCRKCSRPHQYSPTGGRSGFMEQANTNRDHMRRSKVAPERIQSPDSDSARDQAICPTICRDKNALQETARTNLV